MNSQLTPDQKELYRRVDEVLHFLWDPIGVAGVPSARGEYNTYVHHVFSMLVERANSKVIAEYLVKTQTESMGLSMTPSSRQRAEEIASILEDYRDYIHEEFNKATYECSYLDKN